MEPLQFVEFVNLVWSTAVENRLRQRQLALKVGELTVALEALAAPKPARKRAAKVPQAALPEAVPEVAESEPIAAAYRDTTMSESLDDADHYWAEQNAQTIRGIPLDQLTDDEAWAELERRALAGQDVYAYRPAHQEEHVVWVRQPDPATESRFKPMGWAALWRAGLRTTSRNTRHIGVLWNSSPRLPRT